ncbi:MAG: hypothetical protein ACR2NN_23655 [Bryobacteraceae bacterium]
MNLQDMLAIRNAGLALLSIEKIRLLQQIRQHFSHSPWNGGGIGFPDTGREFFREIE